MAGMQNMLPTTRASQIIQDKGTEAYYLFIILLVFAFVNKFTDNFPLSVIVSIIIYIIFKLYLNGKPPKFLEHLFIYFATPKKYTHQFGYKESLFSDVA